MRHDGIHACAPHNPNSKIKPSIANYFSNASCRLGTYYDRLPGGGRSLFAEGENLKGTQLTDLKVHANFLLVHSPHVMCASSLLLHGDRAGKKKHSWARERVCLQIYVADGPPVEFELDGVVWKTKQG
jgi:hypothetical protein